MQKLVKKKIMLPSVGQLSMLCSEPHSCKEGVPGRWAKSSPPREIAFLPPLSYHRPPTHLHYLLCKTTAAKQMLLIIDDQQ